jgi:NADH dehydrogenase [ubiquinone] 1 alpha subcomplex assembly factor 1
MAGEYDVCDFRKSCLAWRNVDDVVMGGMSASSMRIGEDGVASFSGELSLERNGGFASVRSVPEHRDFTGCNRFRIRVLGDGRRYSFRVRNDDRFDGVVYASDFDTAVGAWLEIDLPFSSFRPLFRGLVVPGAPPFDPGNVAQVGFLVAMKQEGSFRLQVAWIRAVG